MIEGPEAPTDQHLAVRSAVVGPPEHLAVLEIECCDPATDSHLTTAVPHEDPAIYDERRHGHRLTAIDVAQPRLPHHLPTLGVQRDRDVVESVEDDLAVGVGSAAVHDVATRLALR